jgi:hypothetical protein
MIDLQTLFANPVFNIIFSVVTFILGNIFAYILYRRGLGKKQIWWDARDKKIINPYLREISGFRMEYKEIEIHDISVLRLLFWNSGKDVIRQDDIAKKHPICFISCENTRLLDADMIAFNNDTISIYLDRDNDLLIIDFEYLEPSQGMVTEIVYSGPLNELGVAGVVKGGNITFKRARSDHNGYRFPFGFITRRLSYLTRRRATIALTAFCGLFLFVFFVPIVIEAVFLQNIPIDSGFWFVVPRMGLAALLYFWIMISVLRTPRIPSGLEIFDHEITKPVKTTLPQISRQPLSYPQALEDHTAQNQVLPGSSGVDKKLAAEQSVPADAASRPQDRSIFEK